MCSLNGIDDCCENLLLHKKQPFQVNLNCRSCSNVGSVVLRKKDVYCKNCFLITETHKFRAALGKSKVMKPQDTVLVAYSGSQSSVALLHLLHSGMTEVQHKKLIFSTIFLYIDEGALFNLNINERENLVNKIKSQASEYNFSLFITTLSDYFKDSPTLETSLVIDQKGDKNLTQLFDSVKSFTSKEDLLCVLKKQLILKVAEQLNCNKIFTAEVGTDVAVKLLSSFSLGKGASDSYGFCDSHHPNIKILRPLRDFTWKEIIFYNKFYHLEAVNRLTFTTMSPSNISIQKLTEQFVTGLQEGFPSTVYTIFRAAEKIGANTIGEERQNVCFLCKDGIRTCNSRNNYTAVDAANFSRKISRKKIENYGINPKNNSCGSYSKENAVDIDSLELNKFLCYSCLLIVRDMDNIEDLSKHILQKAPQKKELGSMKEEILEFLIGNSPEEEMKLQHT